jgi:hypothetical protein
MNITITQMRTELRDHLGVDDIELPDASADLLIDRAASELMSKFHFTAMQDEQTITTVADQAAYTIPVSTDAIEGLYFEDDVSKQHSPIDRITFDFYEQHYQNSTVASGKPNVYFRRNDEVILHPTPDAVYTLTMYRRKILGDFSTGIMFGPQEWFETILYGAITRGFHKLGDYVRAQASAAYQVGLISSITPTEAKEEYDSRRAGVEFISEDNY